MVGDEKNLYAQKWMLSNKQIQILHYIGKNGITILEKAYEDLHIPKPTTGYHIQRLETFGLIEIVEARGRMKPVRLTELGQAVLKLLEGETLSDEQRIRITALELVVSLGLRTLTKEELERVVKLFRDYLETGAKPSKKDLEMVV